MGSKINENRRCFRSDNSMLNSSFCLPQRSSGIGDLGSISKDEDQTVLKKFLGETKDGQSLEDDIDLRYKMFLEHLKEDGNRIVFETVNYNGVPCLKYQEEDVSYDDLDNQISLRGFLIERTKGGLATKNQKSPSSSERRPVLGKKNQKFQISGLIPQMGSKINENQRCFRSNNSMLNSSFCLPQKSSGIGDLGSISKDEDQTVHKKLLGETSGAQFLEDDIDLGYKMFLEHLKEDGNRIKYQEEDVSYDLDNQISSRRFLSERTNTGLGTKNQKSPTSSERRPVLGKKNQKFQISGLLPQIDSKINEKRRCFHSNNSMLNSSFCLPQKSAGIGDLGSISKDKDQTVFEKLLGETNGAQSLEDDIDLGYKMFLEHPKEDGNTCVLETVNYNGVPVCLKYREEAVSYDELDNQISSRGFLSEQTKAGLGKKNQKSPTSSERRPVLGEKNQKFQISGLIPLTKDRSSSEDSSKINVRPFSPGHNHDPVILVDKDYQTFRDHDRVCGESLIPELENGVVVRYDEENKMPTTSDRGVTKNTIFHSDLKSESHTSDQSSDFSAAERYGNSRKRCSNSCQFKEKLRAVLSRPFDCDEYEKLLKEASSCKALKRQRDLRSRVVSYATSQRGFSYLDYYKDLKKQVESADPQEALTLLRGFFFWLEHLAHEGSFQPWKTSFPIMDTVSVSDSDVATLPDDEMELVAKIELLEDIEEKTATEQ